jgi:hypothetical protein
MPVSGRAFRAVHCPNAVIHAFTGMGTFHRPSQRLLGPRHTCEQ